MKTSLLLEITSEHIQVASKSLPYWIEESKSNWVDFEQLEGISEFGLARRGAQLNAQSADRRIKMINAVCAMPVGEQLNIIGFFSARELAMIDSHSLSAEQAFSICKKF